MTVSFDTFGPDIGSNRAQELAVRDATVIRLRTNVITRCAEKRITTPMSDASRRFQLVLGIALRNKDQHKYFILVTTFHIALKPSEVACAVGSDL